MNIDRQRPPKGCRDLGLWLSRLINDGIRDAIESGLPEAEAKNIALILGRDELADSEDRVELRRAHAAIRWFSDVRAAIGSGALHATAVDEEWQPSPERAFRMLLHVLMVAHALSEVWLSHEPVTARAVADLLGWYGEHSDDAVREWLKPLQTGPHPPLVLDDLRPNIKVDR